MERTSVGSPAGVAAGDGRAIAGAEREQREGATAMGRPRKMVTSSGRLGARHENQLVSDFPRATNEAMRWGCARWNPRRETCAAPANVITWRCSTAKPSVRGIQAAELQAGGFFGKPKSLSDGRHGKRRGSAEHVWEGEKKPRSPRRKQSGVEGGRSLDAGAFAKLGRGIRQDANAGSATCSLVAKTHHTADRDSRS